MKEVCFRCRVLTPMFLGGPVPNAAPEFRSPSLRGLLRYWYRALLGARDTTDPERLRKASSAVFGSTNRASTIRVRMRAEGTPKTRAPSELLCGEGRSYLWHFVQAGDNNRPAISPNQPFEVRFSTLPRRAGTAPDTALQEAIRAFWLLVHLGGLGARSRRCAGAFRARYEHHPANLPLPSFTPESPHHDWLQAQLRALDLGQGDPSTAEFDHLGRARIWSGTGDFARASVAVDEIGAAYKDFRGRLTDGQKVFLGLPIGQDEDRVQVEGPDGEIERRASPFWMQLVETPSGRCRPIYTLFGGPFLSDPGETTPLNGAGTLSLWAAESSSKTAGVPKAAPKSAF